MTATFSGREMLNGLPSNTDRAAWAESAVHRFRDETRGGSSPDHWTEDSGEDHADLVADLICDLGHYADKHGLSFTELVERGVGMWSAEKHAPDGDPYRNNEVTVTIEPMAAEDRALNSGWYWDAENSEWRKDKVDGGYFYAATAEHALAGNYNEEK